MQGGDTCVIELLGLSAAGLHIEMDRKKKYRAERIKAIRRKLAENTPEDCGDVRLHWREAFRGDRRGLWSGEKWLNMKRRCLFMLTIQRDSALGTLTAHGMISEPRCEQMQVTEIRYFACGADATGLFKTPGQTFI